MRLVKTIRRKFFKLLKNLFTNVARHAFFLRAIHKLHAHLGHEFSDLFPHGFAQRISLTTCEARHILGHLHDLLLVHRNTIRVCKRILEQRMHVRNFFASVFARNKRINKLHRARTIQRDHSNDIFNHCRFKFADVPLHAIRFQLKDTRRFPFSKQLKCFDIIQR